MMFRRLAAVVLAAGLLSVAYADLSACGDKFMRVGRSSSGRRYAAIHPSSILIYRPAGATPRGMADFETLLKKAGHEPRVLQRGEDVAPILASAKYSLLIAEYSDVEALKNKVDVAPARPAILPILLDANKPVEAQLRKDFHCLIRPRAMTDNEALAEIDHALEFRLKEGRER